MSNWTHYRARVASLSRDRLPDDPELLAARRDLREARLGDAIKAAVQAAPPLAPDQIDRLGILLRGGASNVA